MNSSRSSFPRLFRRASWAENVRIAEVLRTAEREEATLLAQCEALRQEKSALMREVLSGARRLPSAALEPAPLSP